ncbi:type II toxin-antitoxin system ParD family antitoxin [Enterovirga rhinocerotis]|uniref:Antitoxin ParD1/3/4 n=1 Tax=Enterovirga rhinocerotis TaxID=1339210 RepID=A0A4R7C3X3_9HYPH|nr:type II toxin-antitoxin system ParD family antitoxin [Enterovirga rhinocerotis]TDR93154.1 antitoxin ParD1/3/4 [Enterovirga rhinocerotis]
MPTMNVSLTAEMADFVQSEVQSGRYVSASELVRDGLRMLAYERAQESEKAALLKAAVQAGIDDVEAGRISDRSVDDILQEVLAEGRR